MTEHKIFTKKIIFLSSLMLTSGTLSIMMMKLQNEMKYKHALTQTVQIFMGEYLNIFILVIPLIYLTRNKLNPGKTNLKSSLIQGNDTSVEWYRLGLGGLLDAFGSTLSAVSLFLIPPSSCLMMGNGVIIFTTLFTVTYLKKN